MVDSHRELVCAKLPKEDLEAVFKFLPPEDVDELCSYLTYHEYEPGSILMREGEMGEYMGFLVSGRLEIKKETSFPGRYVIVAMLDRGTMVGEMAAVERRPRSATVQVQEKTRLLILTTDEMDRLLREKPQLGIKLLKRILYILSVRLTSAGDRLSWLL